MEVNMGLGIFIFFEEWSIKQTVNPGFANNPKADLIFKNTTEIWWKYETFCKI